MIHRRVRHRYNRELGTGRIVAVEGRTWVVEFPETGTVLRLAADSDALEPIVFHPGDHARLEATGEEVLVERVGPEGHVQLSDGRSVRETELVPVDPGEPLFERLARAQVDSLEDVALRLDALHLQTIRQAGGLGSFLGGRIRIFPHQLYVAERAAQGDPVRWLLADEVGLGKTVEACLILNHLLRTRRAERTLVVAPETLTIQWLGELWRKYHQVFVLLDEERLRDVDREHGRGFNPFDTYRRVVVGLEFLTSRPRLTRQAVEAGVDLLVVDEAHHLRRPPGHPGNREYRAIQPIAALGRHVLLLTATPLEDDVHGFFVLLQLLRPQDFPDEESFRRRLERREALPPCTSATRRSDIGGLPPRVPRAVEIEDPAGWATQQRLILAVARLPAPHAAARKRKAELLARAVASGAALAALTTGRQRRLRRLARRADDEDPRVRWLVRHARRWKDAGEKTLVFVAHRETLEMLRTALRWRAHLASAAFHEALAAVQRDLEVARFRRQDGPPVLVSTECGGEGRNFEFCTRLVLFDLPWDPMVVEQRIGRLDRIGRTQPVEIVYFRPPRGLGRLIAEVYERLGLFREPLGGLQQQLRGVRDALVRAALSGAEGYEDRRFRRALERARRARDRVAEAAFHELHREPYRPEMAEGILARIPPDLEELTEQVVVTACERLGLHVERQRGAATYSIELGRHALVENLPGVPAGASFVGSFDREEAVAREELDFFASGHPLVEGVLAQLEESPLGRAAFLDVRMPQDSRDPHRNAGAEEIFGLLGIYRRESGFEARAVDLEGRERPDLVALLTRRPLRSRRVKPETWAQLPGWRALVRSLARRHFSAWGSPVAVAAFRVRTS